MPRRYVTRITISRKQQRRELLLSYLGLTVLALIATAGSWLWVLAKGWNR